jgi:hypothetical protein
VELDAKLRRRADRAELGVEASGNDADETRRALGWARDFLTTPDWRPENLPRIRDVVDEALTGLHDTMSGPEEAWVEDVEEAYRRQDRAVLVHATSFLTRAHDAFAVSWRLQGGDDARGVAPFLETLAGAGKKLDRAALAKLTTALASDDPKAKLDPAIATWVRAGRTLPKPAQSRVRKAGRDLGRFLVDVPDATLAADWAALCREMARGVARPPAEALAELTATLAAVRHASNARLWLVGSPKHQAAVAEEVERTVAALDPSPTPRVEHAARLRVLERARARGLKGDSPFVALMNPNTANGLPGPVREVFEERLRAALPLRVDKAIRRIQDTRSGKMYDARFGVRGKGEGPYAEAIQSLFAQTCAKLGLNAEGRHAEDAPTTFQRPRGQMTLF